MEPINLPGIVAFFQAFGPIGLIALIWYIDMRALRKMHADHKDQVTQIQTDHKEQVTEILADYKEDMAETRRMYERNVRLVQRYQELGGDLKDIIVLNTRAMTELAKDIRTNQYCPAARIEKKTISVGAQND